MLIILRTTPGFNFRGARRRENPRYYGCVLPQSLRSGNGLAFAVEL